MEEKGRKLSGQLAYRHPFLCDSLHFISFELTAETMILFPHRHLLSNDTIFRCVHQTGERSIDHGHLLCKPTIAE